MTLGEKIRSAREDLDLSQLDVAKQIPMNQSNYSKIERDLQEPSIEQLKQICRILMLDPRYLLDIEDFEIFTPKDRQLLIDIQRFLNDHK